MYSKKFIKELLLTGDHTDSIAVYIEHYDKNTVFYKKGKRIRKIRV